MSCLNFHRRNRLHHNIALCGQERRHRCAGQVAGQLQALLAEKARLASENARLAHENTSLQVKTRHLPLKAIHAQQEIFHTARVCGSGGKRIIALHSGSVLLNVRSIKVLLATILRSIRGLMCLSTAYKIHHI